MSTKYLFGHHCVTGLFSLCPDPEVRKNSFPDSSLSTTPARILYCVMNKRLSIAVGFLRSFPGPCVHVQEVSVSPYLRFSIRPRETYLQEYTRISMSFFVNKTIRPELSVSNINTDLWYVEQG